MSISNGETALAKASLPQQARRIKEQRWLAAEPLDVSPALVGLPLASPARRAQAMLVDLALLALLGEAAGFWLVAGLALVVLLLRSPRLAERRRQRIGWIFAAVLGLLALQEAWDSFSPQSLSERRAERRAEAAADARAAAIEKAAEAAEAVAERALDGTVNGTVNGTVSGTADSAAKALAAAASAATSAAAASAAPGDAERIVQLQAEIAELKKPRPLRWRDELKRAWDSVGLSFGWGIVYFSLLPAWWNGQTLGKKFFGLRVVELTGRPLTVMRCLRRYGGYAAGMATGGLGFMQALWDVNRQGIQDRVAHTVVVDLRAAAAVPPPLPASDQNP